MSFRSFDAPPPPPTHDTCEVQFAEIGALRRASLVRAFRLQYLAARLDLVQVQRLRVFEGVDDSTREVKADVAQFQRPFYLMRFTNDNGAAVTVAQLGIRTRGGPWREPVGDGFGFAFHIVSFGGWGPIASASIFLAMDNLPMIVSWSPRVRAQ